MPHDLYSTLLAEQTQDGELEQVLGSHFKSATQSEPGEADYPNSSNYSIRLIYEGSAIVDILPGPALTEIEIRALVDAIQTTVIDDAGYLVGHRVLFANVATHGYFKYRDVFQVGPVPAEAPRPAVVHAEHPLSLWCRFKNSPDPLLRISRHTSKAREIELLLTAITTANIHSIGPTARNYWVALPADGTAECPVGFRH